MQSNASFSETGHGCAGVGLRNRSAVRAAVSMRPELGGNRLFSRNDPSGQEAGAFLSAPFLRPGRYQAALRSREFRCGRDLQRSPCHASPGKGSGGSLADSKAGGMAVRPHLCLGQKPKRQTPALVHGAFRLSGVSCLDCRGADGIPVRVRLFHRSPSASRKFVGAAVLSDGQGKIPDERTAARQTTVRSAQLNHTKVKEE